MLTDFQILEYLTTTGNDYDIALCPDFVRGQQTKRGDEIVMGTANGTLTRIATGEWQPVLYLFNKKKFFEIKKAGKLPTHNKDMSNTETPQWLKDLAEAKYPYPQKELYRRADLQEMMYERDRMRESFIEGVQWAMANRPLIPFTDNNSTQ